MALVDNTPVGTVTGAPYDVAWDSSGIANGSHTISATPYDLAGNTGTSNTLDVTTNNFQLAGSTYTLSGAVARQ